MINSRPLIVAGYAISALIVAGLVSAVISSGALFTGLALGVIGVLGVVAHPLVQRHGKSHPSYRSRDEAIDLAIMVLITAVLVALASLSLDPLSGLVIGIGAVLGLVVRPLVQRFDTSQESDRLRRAVIILSVVGLVVMVGVTVFAIVTGR